MPNTDMHILVIDDDKEILGLFLDIANELGVTCTITTSFKEFLYSIDSNVKIVFIDLIMPELDGIELLRKLKESGYNHSVILMSGADHLVLENSQELAESLGLHVGAILQKPFHVAEIENIITSIHDKYDDSKKNTTKSQDGFLITKQELQDGINFKQFLLHYQPQLDIVTKKIIGVEALVRWNHPSYGLIYPDQFIQRAESFGLIDDVGLYVAHLALNEIKHISIKEDYALRVAINISPYSLHDLRLPDKMSEIAKSYSFDPSNIIFEITESGLIHELTTALDILTRLRIKQFKLAIDDFGIGYSMIDQIRHVPATELKIDKSLTQSISEKDSVEVMIIKIIEMGHELGMKIIAEGVENKQQLDFLTNNNCDLVQGYLISKPLSLNELLIWMKNHHTKNA